MRLGRLTLFTLSGIAIASTLSTVFFALMPNYFDDRPDHEICFDLEGSVTKTVPACTALIDSGRYSGNDLARHLFRTRDVLRELGQNRPRDPDFNESNRICPTSGKP